MTRMFKVWLLLVIGAFVGSSASARDLSPDQIETLKANFAKADTDKDGSLTPQEVQAMPRIAPAFSKIDTDGDKKITLQQILAFVASH